MSDPGLRAFDSLVDRLRLHFQANRRAVVLVEGEADRLVLSELLPDRTLFPAGGRQPALTVAEELHASGLCSFVAVFDVDFQSPPPPYESGLDAHLHPCQGRDLEGMLINLGG